MRSQADTPSPGKQELKAVHLTELVDPELALSLTRCQLQGLLFPDCLVVK